MGATLTGGCDLDRWVRPELVGAILTGGCDLDWWMRSCNVACTVKNGTENRVKQQTRTSHMMICQVETVTAKILKRWQDGIKLARASVSQEMIARALLNHLAFLASSSCTKCCPIDRTLPDWHEFHIQLSISLIQQVLFTL